MQEENKEIKGLLYDEIKIQQVLNLLSNIRVNGYDQVKNINDIFDVIMHPIPFKTVEDGEV